MTIASQIDDLATIEDAEQRTDAYLERVETLLPILRSEARASELARSTTPAVISAAADIGFFAGLTPRRWGGYGLGFRALAQSARILAKGDVSGAWQLCFLLEHNWFACHMPWSTQEALYRDRNYILAAGPLIPVGSARRVDGGFRVTGRHQYASALPNSDWAFYSSFLENEDGTTESWVFLSPTSDLHDHDDWYFAGATASGSGSFSTDDTFVPDGYAMPYDHLLSGDRHFGVSHEEPLMRYFVTAALLVMLAGFATGAAERVVELARERIETAKMFGQNRIDQAASRMRWGQAYGRARTIRLQYESLVRRVDEVGERRWTGEELADLTLRAVVLERQALEAIRQLMDGAGSSAFSTSNALQRYLRDINVLTNHAATDWDYQVEASSAALLGVRPFATFGQA